MMHPRNIYNKPIDYQLLSKTYPEFAKITELNTKGKIRIDFKNPESLRIFTKCCLLKDFNLDILLPPDKLLPTIPLRLNYLLWIEDLIKHFEIDDEVKGIDIGCGSSCIYCLLALRNNPSWKMFALEIDEENLKFASENIKKNGLDSKISLISQNNNPDIFENLFQKFPEQKTFCICNPPFFKSHDEMVGENRSGKRKAPSSSICTGSPVELIYEDGGELGFVRKIMNESMNLRERVKIYSTMIGCKKNLMKFKNELQQNGIENVLTTEFTQGKTSRWGVAWSFCLDLASFNKTSSPESSVKAKTKIISHQIPIITKFNNTVEEIKTILNSLEIKLTVIAEKPNQNQWELFASKNTWSSQRAKRRAEANNKIFIEKSTPPQDLTVAMEVKKSKEFVDIKMSYLNGSMSRDCVNQILQFIKNKFKPSS